MSKGATLSIMGLYQNDNTVLDAMFFPEGFTDEQKEIVKQNILIECAELEFLYPAPTVAKTIIGIWSHKEVPYWNRVYQASLLEYNPIENYRRNETETIEDEKTEQHTGTDSTTRTGTETSQAGGSDSQSGSSTTTDTNSGTDTTTNKITGFDSNDLVNHDSSSMQHGHVVTSSASGSSTDTYGRSDTLTRNTVDALQHGEKIEHDGTVERSVLAYGNIGVTTSQDMLTQELEVAKIIQVIPIIIESFKNRFCLMVY